MRKQTVILGVWLICSAIQAGAAEFLVYDETYIAVESEHGFHYFDPAPGAPANWMSPDDFYNGQWQVRYQIITQPTNSPSRFQTCIWQDIFALEACSPQSDLSGPGDIVTVVSTPAAWWKKDGVPVDFSRPQDFHRVGVVMRASNSCIITDWVDPPESCWDRRDEFIPMQMRTTIVAVSYGSVFSGWDNYLTDDDGGIDEEDGEPKSDDGGPGDEGSEPQAEDEAISQDDYGDGGSDPDEAGDPADESVAGSCDCSHGGPVRVWLFCLLTLVFWVRGRLLLG